MGKKKLQSLTERIESLINRVGEQPAPSMADLKSELVPCLGLAQSLEDGAAICDAEAKAEALQQEVANLKFELQSLKTEVESFRAERKEQGEAERKKELPAIQFEILELLPSEQERRDRPDVKLIANTVCVEVYEAEIHLDRLVKAGLVTFGENSFGVFEYHRTIPGSELVLAKRLAGEKAVAAKRKYPNLPQIQHEILLLIAAGEDDGASEQDIAKKLHLTTGKTRYNLKLLREADLAADPLVEDYGTGICWFLRDKGAEYLYERDLL